MCFHNPGDGIQECPASPNDCALRSSHEAPTIGYEAQLARTASAHPGQPTKHLDFDEHRIYVFRVETVLDETGKVKSALYGKIYGDFMQFTYYLNPTPNDRNIEFDPKHNLFHGSNAFEDVRLP